MKKHIKEALNEQIKDEQSKYWKDNACKMRFEYAVKLANIVNDYVYNKDYLVFHDGSIWEDVFLISEYAINSIKLNKPSVCKILWIGNGYKDKKMQCVWTETKAEINKDFGSFRFMKISEQITLKDILL